VAQFELRNWAVSAPTGSGLNGRYPADSVEKLLLKQAPVADSLLLGAGDSADDGRAAGDAGGAVLPERRASSPGNASIRPFTALPKSIIRQSSIWLLGEVITT
jgi:hypothetical protein